MNRIGPYKLVRVLGAGGMGQVFQATDSRNGQTVAIKVIRSKQAANEAARMRFVQEASAALQLRHPNIVTIHDFGQAKGVLYIAMECLDGLPLTRFIPGPPTLSLLRKLSIMAQCADALGYAHSFRIVHRDVKPANLIVLADESVKLLDFGLAQLINLQNPNTPGGTPPYMSPEQLGTSGDDARTDIWAAGITLFELLTGRLPFRSVGEILSGPVPALNRDFPFAMELNAVLGRALAKDRGDRYLKVNKFAADLRAISLKWEEAEANDRAESAPITASIVTLTMPPSTLAGEETGIAVVHPATETEWQETGQPSATSSSGNNVMSELGFQCRASGDLESRAGAFCWSDRANRLRSWRNRVFDRYNVHWLVVAWIATLVVWIGALALWAHLSPDALGGLLGFGFLCDLIGWFILIGLSWLTVSVAIKACPVLGSPEHLPQCKGCTVLMRRTDLRTRVCSSREEVFFGYRDCMAALKHRLWPEAAKLLSIYGEKSPSKYRDQFISASIRYRVAFFECRTCCHHAARLTSEEMIQRQWEEKFRFEEVYWGTATNESPGSRFIGSWSRAMAEVMGTLFQILPTQRLLKVCLLLVLLPVLWIFLTDTSKLPVSKIVSVVALSDSGQWLAAGKAGGKISVWDTTSGAMTQVFIPGNLRDLHFSPAGDVLAIAGRDLILYRPSEPSAPRTLRADHKYYQSVRFSPDGQTLVTVTAFGMIETMDAHTGQSMLRLCCTTVIGRNWSGEASFTPDGQAIVNSGTWPGVWNARSGEYLGRLPTNTHSGPFFSLDFDWKPDIVLMAENFGTVWSWNWKTRKYVRGVSMWPFSVQGLTSSGIGWVISSNSNVSLWYRVPGERRNIVGATPSSNLIFSKTGDLLVFGTANSEIEFWNLDEARLVRTIKISDN